MVSQPKPAMNLSRHFFIIMAIMTLFQASCFPTRRSPEVEKRAILSKMVKCFLLGSSIETESGGTAARLPLELKDILDGRLDEGYFDNMEFWVFGNESGDVTVYGKTGTDGKQLRYSIPYGSWEEVEKKCGISNNDSLLGCVIIKCGKGIVYLAPCDAFSFDSQGANVPTEMP
jgi:hypothetical protein